MKPKKKNHTTFVFGFFLSGLQGVQTISAMY